MGFSYPLIFLGVLLLFSSVTSYRMPLPLVRSSPTLKLLNQFSLSKPWAKGLVMRSHDSQFNSVYGSQALAAVATPIDVDPNKTFMQKYVSALVSKPITTKSIQSAIGLAIGNIIAQKFLSKVKLHWTLSFLG